MFRLKGECCSQAGTQKLPLVERDDEVQDSYLLKVLSGCQVLGPKRTPMSHSPPQGPGDISEEGANIKVEGRGRRSWNAVAIMNNSSYGYLSRIGPFQHPIVDTGGAYKATALPKDLLTVNVCYGKRCHFLQWCRDWRTNWKGERVLRERKEIQEGNGNYNITIYGVYVWNCKNTSLMSGIVLAMCALLWLLFTWWSFPSFYFQSIYPSL